MQIKQSDAEGEVQELKKNEISTINLKTTSNIN
jgi:hypothetical protein